MIFRECPLASKFCTKTKKKETAVDGTKDENVFDIQQGVAVCIMIKDQGGT